MVFILSYSLRRLRRYRLPSMKSLLKELPLEHRRKQLVFRIIQYNEKMDVLLNGGQSHPHMSRADLENDIRGEYSDIYMCDKMHRKEKRDRELFRNHDRLVTLRKLEKIEAKEEERVKHEVFRNVVNRSWYMALRKSKRRRAGRAQPAGGSPEQTSNMEVCIEESGAPEKTTNPEVLGNQQVEVNAALEFNLQDVDSDDAEMTGQPTNTDEPGNLQDCVNLAPDFNLQVDVNSALDDLNSDLDLNLQDNSYQPTFTNTV